MDPEHDNFKEIQHFAPAVDDEGSVVRVHSLEHLHPPPKIEQRAWKRGGVSRPRHVVQVR